MITRYWVIHYGSSSEVKSEQFFAKFDKIEIQKIFDQYVKNSLPGDIIEYGKEDNKEFHPHMFTVENVKGEYKSWAHRGHKTFFKNYKVESNV